MADQKKVFVVLKEAKKQNLIFPKSEYNVCFLQHINTANQILYCVESLESCDVEQILNRMHLNENTVKIYLRSLTKLGFLKADKQRKSCKLIWSLNEK